jgi:hypothetical protein
MTEDEQPRIAFPVWRRWHWWQLRKTCCWMTREFREGEFQTFMEVSEQEAIRLTWPEDVDKHIAENPQWMP